MAFINPHGFLDNPTFRGMRWNLLQEFDKIYTIDLHGNSKKKETAPDGSVDQNVFDIMQGVSINLFVKTGNKKANELGQVFHYDLYGKRELKYDFLNENSIQSIPFNTLENIAPNYFMVQNDFGAQKKYDNGFKINDLFQLNNVGIVTARDSFTIHNSKELVKQTIEKFLSLEDEDAREYFKLGKDVRDWQVGFAKNDLKMNFKNDSQIIKVSYRLFDDKWSLYTGKSKGFHCYPRNEVMKHFLNGKNLGISLCKQFKSGETYQHVFITNKIIESSFVSNKTSEITSVFPLYLYSDTTQTSLEEAPERTPNLNMKIVNEIAVKLGLTFTNEKETTEGTFAPIDLLDYIYAVLHSPKYRETYKEFLKIDFPRVPYPTDQNQFWDLVALGKQIREIHLLESPKVEDFISSYPVEGTNIVGKPKYAEGKVYINDTQYFDNVPEVAWHFYIGGYQPAQKWLKDRKNIELSYDDILHYNKIIVALTETDRLMKAIDNIWHW
ncbi:type ISP restriction/modification enzyme [Vaginella massiliensis]|uniref:type ISP restriction/modification enzyme n=1 Tax=Vaginella massiliensis TaxID=1816680 RepID=UPI003753CED3